MTTKERRHYRCKAVTFKEDDDSDTEVEEFNLESRKSDERELQIIHSGHFMVSSLHIEHTPKKGYDFDTVNKQTCRTYHFGKTSTSHLSIDASLTKLFECMTLAYSGTLVSPKWKNFKGLKLLVKDKIRLNNAIWRAWYMQYVRRRENPICHFVTPLDGSIETEDRSRPEAIYTEGKGSKRAVDVVREYHKWRTYFKKRLQKHKDEDLSSLLKGSEEHFSLFGEISSDILQNEEMGLWRGVGAGQLDSPVPMEMDSLFDIEVLMSESSDTLFSTLASHQPLGWPNPRDIAHNGNADMIQPGLGNLQPNLDLTFDPFELFQDLFHSLRQPAPSVSFPTSAAPPPPSTACPPATSLLPSATTSPKMPCVSGTGHAGAMRTAPSHARSYPSLSSAPPTSVPESAPAPPVAPTPPDSLPRHSPATTTWNPAAVGSPAPPKPAEQPALRPPKAPAKPGARPLALGGGTAGPPAHPPALPPPKPSRRSRSIVPAKPRPPPPLFVTGPVLIAHSPLQTEAPPPSNMVIASGDITQGVRPSYISAEQKRRFSINLGFRSLCTLVPTLKSKSSCSPVTNATTLQKTVEYIGKLQQERLQMQEETRRLREEIEELNASICSCHQKLPATGVPVARNRLDCMWDKFNEYVRNRTLQNWKFWIFSIIIKPLFESFTRVVSTGSVQELRQTTLRWLEQYCSLPALRPGVLDALLQLSTTTSILADPSRLPEEVCRAVGCGPGNASRT